MNDSGSRRRPARAPVLGLAALAATSALAQPPDLAPLSETIEVRVVNVDVMVTDPDGVPIAGLGAEDFELLVDGKPVAIDYFTSIRDGSPLPAGGGGGAAGAFAAGERLDVAADLEYKPYLAVVFDGRSLSTVGVEEVFDALRLRAEVLTDSTRGVLVARHGRALRFNQGFTRQPQGLRLAIEELAKVRPRAVDTSGRAILLRRLERAQPAPAVQDPDDSRGNFEIEAEATSFLGEIRAAAQEARSQNANAMNDLARFVRSLAGLPGRKCLLYLGPGFNTRPGEVLLRLWWAKYSPLAREVGLASVESEVVKYGLDQDLVRLIREASENNVSFYTFDPQGLRPIGFDSSFASVATELLAAETDGARRTLQSLATGTGGIGRIDSGRLDLLIDHMTADFRTYYSLGFEPAAEAPDSGRIQVKASHPAYRVRHLERFASRGPRRQLEERTLAALLTDDAANPLAVGVELESGEKQKDGTWVMPILLKVPLAGVTLLPREATHVGRLQVVVIAQSAEGDLSEPAHGDMPIEIDNGELLAALGRQAGYRMRLRMRQGEQRLAIGVRDEITGEESTVNLVVDAGGPSRK